KQVAPISIVQSKYETGSSFTNSGLFNNYYFFGYIFGAVVNILSGVFIGFLVYMLCLGIYSNNLIFLFFSFKSYIKIHSIIFTGNVNDVFTFSTFLFIFLFFVFIRVGRGNSNYRV